MIKKNFIRVSWQENLVHLIIIAVWPLLLLLINNNWIFTPATGFIDPWLYLGYFLNLPQHLRIFPNTYYGARLPWILPGFAVHRLFSPVLANYLLHLSFYYLAVFSIYFTLQLIFNHRTAILTTLLMGSYVWFMRSIGWDYVDGAAIAYLCSTIFLVTKSSASLRYKFWIFFAGFFYGAAVLTYFFLIFFVVFLAIYYLYLGVSGFRKIMSSILYFTAGFFVICILLCHINYNFNHVFWFFLPSFNTSLDLISRPNPWRAPVGTWLRGAMWLAWPIALGITGLILLFFRRIKIIHFSGFSKYFVIQYLLIFLAFITLDLTGHTSLTKHFYAADYLIPWMFLFIGAISSTQISHLTDHQFKMLFLGMTILLIFSYEIFVIFSNHPENIFIQSILVPVLICMLGFLSLIFIKSKIFSLYSFFFFLIISNSLLGTEKIFNGINYWPVANKTRENSYLLVANSMRVINKINPLGDSYFWHGNDGFTKTGIYTAIASTYLWGFRLLSFEYPSLKTNIIMQPGTKIVLLSDNPDVFAKALSALKQHGVSARLTGQKKVSQDNLFVYLTFMTTEKLQ